MSLLVSSPNQSRWGGRPRPRRTSRSGFSGLNNTGNWADVDVSPRTWRSAPPARSSSTNFQLGTLDDGEAWVVPATIDDPSTLTEIAAVVASRGQPGASTKSGAPAAGT